MRRRASLAILLAAATAATLVAAVVASLAPPAATGVPMAAAEPGMTVCAPLQVLARHPGSVAGLDDTTYRLNQGSVTVATPGAGFSVASADRAVRAAIGVGALPSAVRWLVEMPDMRYDPSGPLCQGRATAAPAAVSGSTSDNWGGVVVYQPGGSRAFWQAAANWTIPHFTTSCGPDSDHSMWTGIGGFAKTPARLMQAGVDTVIGDGASDPDAVYPFWEVLNYQNSPDNIEPIVQVPLAMHAGDSVTILTEYLASQDKVVFWFLDRTTGQYKLYSLTSLYGHLPSFFYDGQSAEVTNRERRGGLPRAGRRRDSGLPGRLQFRPARQRVPGGRTASNDDQQRQSDRHGSRSAAEPVHLPGCRAAAACQPVERPMGGMPGRQVRPDIQARLVGARQERRPQASPAPAASCRGRLPWPCSSSRRAGRPPPSPPWPGKGATFHAGHGDAKAGEFRHQALSAAKPPTFAPRTWRAAMAR